MRLRNPHDPLEQFRHLRGAWDKILTGIDPALKLQLWQALTVKSLTCVKLYASCKVLRRSQIDARGKHVVAASVARYIERISQT